MDKEEEIDIVAILNQCWKKRKVIAIIMIVSLFVGIVYTFFVNTNLYKSKVKIVIDKSDASISEFVNSKDLKMELADELNINKTTLINNMKVTFDKNTRIVSISADSNKNNQAYEIVNRYQEKLKTKLEQNYENKTYTIIEKPRVENEPYNVSHKKDIIMFGFAGIVICAFYLFIIVQFSGLNIYKEIKNNNLTLLGKIDKEKKENTKIKSYISKNEKTTTQFKRIMGNIELNKNRVRPKTLLVSGTKYGDGTTFVTVNLAIRYSKVGKRVLILDSNIRNGVQNKIFNIESEKGLTNLLLAEDITIDDIRRYIQESPIDNVYVLPIGENLIEEEMLLSTKVSKILNMIKTEFDIVLIDSEPVSKRITPLGWANIVEAIVIVAEQGKFKIDEVVKTKENFENVNGTVLGLILNKAE